MTQPRLSFFNRAWAALTAHIGVADLAVFLAAFIAVNFGVQVWAPDRSGLLLEFGFEVATAWLLAYFAHYYRQGGEVYQRIEGTVASFLEGESAAHAISRISLARLPAEVAARVSRLEAETGQNLAQTYGQLFAAWARRVDRDARARLVMQHLAVSEVIGVSTNRHSMPLPAYLKVLLDAIELAMAVNARETKRRLVVHSFTNALPRDWFSGNPVVGSHMEDYGERLRELITRMRVDGAEYRRTIVSGGQSLQRRGFPSRAEVESSWRACSEEQERTYLECYHTAPELATVIELPDGLHYCETFTELIYFGLRSTEPTSEPEWMFCLASAYTGDNSNVTAGFFNLEDEDRDIAIIHVDNEDFQPMLNPRKRHRPPQVITISLDEYPSMIRDLAVGHFQVRNIVPLADRWDIAAQLWHQPEEVDVVRRVLTGAGIAQSSLVLDAAAGNGFHAGGLANAGYKIEAMDYDPGNVDILRRRHPNIPVSVGDWRDIPAERRGPYDAVLCLGSSITYFESWNATVRELASDWTEIGQVIQGLKGVLRQGGVLVIGVSRHYDKRLDGTSISFGKRKIDNAEYRMKWELRFDWGARRKHWLCEVADDNGNDLSFSLVSHLADREEIAALARNYFSNVRVVDIDQSFYDVFVVASD